MAWLPRYGLTETKPQEFFHQAKLQEQNLCLISGLLNCDLTSTGEQRDYVDKLTLPLRFFPPTKSFLKKSARFT